MQIKWLFIGVERLPDLWLEDVVLHFLACLLTNLSTYHFQNERRWGRLERLPRFLVQTLSKTAVFILQCRSKNVKIDFLIPKNFWDVKKKIGKK